MRGERLSDVSEGASISWMIGALLCTAIALAAATHLSSVPNGPASGEDGSGAQDAATHFARGLRGNAPQRPYSVQTRPGIEGEIDALAGIVRALGMRKIIVCNGASVAADGSPPVDPKADALMRCADEEAGIAALARTVAGADPQAVIFTGTADNAAAFIAELRANHSFAMVVLASSIDRTRVARALPEAASTWVMVADSRSLPPGAAPGSRALTLAKLPDLRTP